MQPSAPAASATSIVPPRPWTALLRPFWRRLLFWRFRLFQRHRHDHLIIEEVAGTPLLVLPQVFNPRLFRSGELLARWTAQLAQPGDRVLDLGTGSGVGAVFAARQGATVIAVDVNPAAVRCARINSLLNGVEERVEVRQGDLFAPVAGERFDLVLFNPPYYRGAPRDALDGAFRSENTIERFAAGLDSVLTPGGRTLLVLSSDADPRRILTVLADQGFRAETLDARDLINETVYVWRLRRVTELGAFE
jgi:release factor glutamine methyltransferase